MTRSLLIPALLLVARALPLAGADVTDYSQRLRNLYTVTSIKVERLVT